MKTNGAKDCSDDPPNTSTRSMFWSFAESTALNISVAQLYVSAFHFHHTQLRGFNVIRPMLLALIVFASTQIALAQEQKPVSAVSQPSNLNPLPANRAELIAASKAQEIPSSQLLDRAWAFYKKWQGAWRPDHTKPTAAERQEILDFTSSLLEKLPSLAKSEITGTEDIDEKRLKAILVVGSPEFRSIIQSEGTQILKSLVLMGLTQHELDIPDGVKVAQPVLIKLLQRTPLDPDLHFLYARLAIDAQQKPAAWHAARAAIFMRSEPTDNDLEFVAFIGSQAAKEQWPTIQVMLKEVAVDQNQAERVIQKAGILFTDKAKSRFIPLPSNPQTP